MSKAYIQLTQSIKVGDQRVTELAGDFTMIDGNATAETIAGLLVIPSHNFLAVVLLADDVDLATLSSDITIVN